MKAVIIDTDILSHYFRNNASVVSSFHVYLQSFSFANISVITYYEILNGLLYKDAKNQITKFNDFVSANIVIPITINSADIAAQIFSDLRKKGQPIGHTDSLIAGTAIANNLILVTNNTNHFNRIEGLQIQNWLT